MTTVAVRGLASPYRGLAPFGESDLDGLLFFGRERETEVVTANLIASRLTVLYGPSGVGKSSLVHAGVARRIRELGARRAVGRGPDLACVVFSSWADDPVAALVAEIGDAVRPLVSPTAPDPPPAVPLADVAEHWSSILDGGLCIVLDQLEEYFVYHEGDDRPGSLVEQLPELVTRPGLRASVLLSVRDDKLARLGVLKRRLPDVFANARRLDRLDRDAARAAILGPLQRWNDAGEEPVEIEPEFVEAVLAQSAATADGALIEAPYLQLVMERVWQEEAARDSRELRLSTLAELGGAAAIVREHLDRALSVLDGEQQEAAARMFSHLVTPSGTKIAHRGSDLAAFAHLSEAQSRDVLDALGRERILRPSDEDAAGGTARYEIFHDVLAQAILEWGQRRDVLVERVAAHRRQRRLLAVAATAILAAAVMVAVTLYALGQRGDARAQTRHARASALAAGALAELPTDPDLGLLLAREAARYDRTDAIENALRTALVASRGRAVLLGQKRGVLAVGFSAGRVVTVDGTGTLRTFPPRTSKALSTRALGGRVRAAAFAADGSAVAVARRLLVELRTLGPAGKSFAFRGRSPVRAIAIDPRGARVAVASLDRRITVRDAAGEISTVRPAFAPTSLALGAAGRTLVAAGGDRVAVWSSSRRHPVVLIDAQAHVTGVAVAPDGLLVATAGADGAVRLWRTRDGRLAGIGFIESPLTGVAFSPDGKALVATSTDGRARILDVGEGRLISVLARQRGALTAAAFSRDGRLLVTGSADGVARIWDPGVAPDLEIAARPTGCCTALTTGSGGVLVAAGRRTIRYRDGDVAAVYRQAARVTSVASTADGAVIGGTDGRVRVWRTSAAPTLTLDLGEPVSAVAATRSMIVAAGADGKVVVWSATGRMVLGFRERSGVAGLAVSHDERLLATAGADGVARIRDPRSGRLLHELAGHAKALTAVAFTPDDTLIATSSFDHDVRLWTVATGRLAHLLRAHFAVVSDVAFSPDGRWLVTAGPTTAGLWRTSSGEFLAYLRGHTARVVGAGFTADGREVTTASADGTIRRYRCDICGTTDALLELASSRLAATGSSLGPGELRRYVSP